MGEPVISPAIMKSLHLQRQSFRYSSIVPLGLKCEDYVLQNLAMDVEKDEEHEETDDEDEDEEDEPNQVRVQLNIHTHKR